ncbi:MAG: inositol-3-phosphate synthase [Ktedonobacteraceae bacterium]
MTSDGASKRINIAIAGLGNCAASFIEGLCFYRQHPDIDTGLLFPVLCGYSVRNMDVVAAFDISLTKVGLLVREAMYQPPNNFLRIKDLRVDDQARVFRGPTLDGNPEHLARFVEESSLEAEDVVSILKDHNVDVLVNLLPTGSIQATEFYAQAALDARCAFVNCIPTIVAQRIGMQEQFTQQHLPLFGDDIKSQIGTTILHRTLLHMLEVRGAQLNKTSQVNIGGNTDFANFVYRAETKLVSKRKSLERYVKGVESHVGHHYDPTKGPLKNAFIEIEASVFGGSPVKISVRLESDDKPNSAGSLVDLVRLAKGGPRSAYWRLHTRSVCILYEVTPK